MKTNQGGAEPTATLAPNAPIGAGRPCSVCGHPDRIAIDAALVEGMLPTDVSKKFGISKQAALRHRTNHVPTPAMQQGLRAVAAEEAVHGAALVQRANALLTTAEEIVSEARLEKDAGTALAAIREAARVILTIGKLTHEIPPPQLSITFAPTLISLQTTMLTVLAAYPEARAAVLMALAGAGNGPLLIEG